MAIRKNMLRTHLFCLVLTLVCSNNVEIVNSNLLWKLEIVMSYKVSELITAG